MSDLFSAKPYQPLAARMRPQTLDDYMGQAHIMGPDKPLYTALKDGVPHSMVLWGPPGVGKTTLAKMVANLCNAEFITLSAVMAGVKDIRAAVERARQVLATHNRKTILFVDEVHRFNKAQQDGFLPFIEDGTLIFIGATTENPSFELNNALLSRVRVYVLKPLTDDDLVQLIERALASGELNTELVLTEDLKQQIAQAADGDARRALNLLEIAADLAEENGDAKTITQETLELVLQESTHRFDKGGDLFYEQISALHKSVRGSSPDASLYWVARMLEGGCDPLYIARRVVRMASEDIGNADPRALQIAMDAWLTYERLGSPEGELAIVQAVVYMACAPKSNAVYTAYKKVMQDIKNGASEDVPMHLRNAPTRMMKDMGYGDEYRYAHDEADGYAAGENYLPEALKDRRYYEPVNRGLEQKIAEKLKHLRQLDKASPHQRYSSKKV